MQRVGDQSEIFLRQLSGVTHVVPVDSKGSDRCRASSAQFWMSSEVSQGFVSKVVHQKVISVSVEATPAAQSCQSQMSLVREQSCTFRN